MSAVYFIQAGDERGPIKVGYSFDPEKRLAEIKTGNHLPLRLLASFELGDDASLIEREIHRALASLRMAGEWFGYDGRIAQLIAVANDSVRREYRCTACDCIYVDHGYDISSMTARHRQIMAALAVSTFAEVEQRVAVGKAFAASEDPSWVGQECGDASLSRPSCVGRLDLVSCRADAVKLRDWLRQNGDAP